MNEFGSAMPYGSCTVVTYGTVCGWPLDKNSKCIATEHGVRVHETASEFLQHLDSLEELASDLVTCGSCHGLGCDDCNQIGQWSVPTEAPFVCPKCGAKSWHPEDKRQGYCGRCHAFTGEDRTRR